MFFMHIVFVQRKKRGNSEKGDFNERMNILSFLVVFLKIFSLSGGA